MSINGIRIVKSGQKSAPLNLSNARRKTYAELQNMTAEQKKGVIICSDYPTEPVSGANVEYSSGVSVNDAIDGKVAKSGDTMSGSLFIDKKDGTTTAKGTSYLTVGNNIPAGTDKNSKACLQLFGEGAYYTLLQAPNSTANRTINMPDKAGTVALTSASFTTLSSTNESGFCKDVATTLNSKMNSNTWITDAFVWAGHEYYICTAVKADGMVVGTLQCASANVAMYTFNYTISSDAIRICKFAATAIS